MSRKLLIIIVALLLYPLESTSAQDFISGQIIINNDRSAKIDWEIPCAEDGSQLYFYNTFEKKYGITGVPIKYISTYTDGTGSTVSNLGVDNDIAVTCGKNSTSAHFIYETNSILKGPGYIYEIPIVFLPEKGYTKKYTINVTYPNSLTFSSSSKTHLTSSVGNLTFEYDFSGKSTSTGDNLRLNFIESPLRAGVSNLNFGNLNIYSFERSALIFKKITQHIPLFENLFKETLGINFDKDIVVFVADLPKMPIMYESGAIAFGPNIILINDEEMQYSTPIALLQVLTHEITHIITPNTSMFRGIDFNATWFKEGLAVFHQFYIIDSYLSKSDADIKTNQLLSGYEKFLFKNLNKEYSKGFDYDFLVDTPAHPISKSYSHAGLVFYKLFLDDHDIFKKLTSKLKDQLPNPSCQKCDSDKILSAFSEITGKTREQILFPFKDLTVLPIQYTIIFSTEIDKNTELQIQKDYYKNVPNYFNNDTKVESTERNIQRTTNKNNDTNAVSEKSKKENAKDKQESPTGQVEHTYQEKSKSFFGKIWLWFINLFK